jgi:hypothetical protein
VKFLQQYVSSTLFPTLGIENKTLISRGTPRAWLKSLQQYVSSTLFPTLGIENKASISRGTARAWLKSLVFEYKQHKKGIYVDEHERPDAVQYRRKFLDELKTMDDVLLEYDEKDLTTEVPRNR